MNKKLIFTVLFAFICMISAHGDRCCVEAATVSQAECVTEVGSRRFLSDMNADHSLPMASTTKILTAIIIIEDCPLDEEVIVPKEGAGIEGSSVYLKEGEVLTVRDLLYGLMLRSGNDCAVTLALHHSGSISTFAEVMNRRAERMGVMGSRFENPHGLPNKNHYTTARDLALISSYAIQNPIFLDVVSCRYYQPKNWQNKNKMLYRYEGAVGVKTGFTVLAGRCLVTAAERNGMTLVCVVLNSPQMYERTEELLNAAFSSYKLNRICTEGEVYCERLSSKETFDYPLKEGEEVKLRIDKFDNAQGKSGDVGGRMEIYLENNLIFSQNLYII